MDLSAFHDYNYVKNNCKGGMNMRKYYLDNIRWMTVVIVVIYHVFYMYNGEGVLGGVGKITDLKIQYYDMFQYLVYPWFMPVLFLVAGISSALYLEKHSGKEFLKSRTRKLLVPSTIGLFAFQFLQGYVNLSISNAFADMAEMGLPKAVMFLVMIASGSGVLWFVHLLWLYSVLLLLVRKIEKGKLLQAGSRTPLWLIALFYFPVWGAAQILNAPIISVYRCGFYLAFFFLGYYVFSREEVIGKLKRYALLLIVVSVILCVSFAIWYFLIQGGMNYADAPANRGALYVACAYFGSLAVLAGMARYGDFSNAFTRWMSRNSFGLYVFHYLGISSVGLFIAKPKLLPAPACYLLSLLAGFAFGYGLYAIIAKIPVYRWAVLGIRGERAPERKDKKDV